MKALNKVCCGVDYAFVRLANSVNAATNWERRWYAVILLTIWLVFIFVALVATVDHWVIDIGGIVNRALSYPPLSLGSHKNVAYVIFGILAVPCFVISYEASKRCENKIEPGSGSMRSRFVFGGVYFVMVFSLLLCRDKFGALFVLFGHLIFFYYLVRKSQGELER